MELTFDHNCLIDLELQEHNFTSLQQLISWHDSGDITIRVSAIQASERKSDKTFVATFSEFQKRIERLSRRPFKVLLPPAYLGIAYLGHCILGSDGLERQIHEILFPNIPFEWKLLAQKYNLDPSKVSKGKNKNWIKWRNKKCDVLALWCHIRNHGDIFVTRDGKFHQKTKRSSLEKLGANHILHAPAAVQEIAKVIQFQGHDT